MTLHLNYIDFVIIGLGIFFTVKGLLKGFVHEVLGLLGLLVAFVVATKYMSTSADYLGQYLRVPSTLASILGFLSIYLGVVLIVHVLTLVIQKVLEYSALGWIDKVIGALGGLGKAGIVISLAALGFSLLPIDETAIPGVSDSRLLGPVTKAAPWTFNMLMKFLPDSKSFYGEVKETFDRVSQDEEVTRATGVLDILKSLDELPEDLQNAPLQ